MSTLFKVDGRLFKFPAGTIPEGSLLSSFLSTQLPVEKDGDCIVLNEVEPEAMKIVHDYLVHGVLPEPEHLHIMDAFQIESYELASCQEDYMRRHMYDPEFQQHEVNTDPHYGLVEINEALWRRLTVQRPDDPNLLFTQQRLEKRSWDEVQASLKKVARFCRPEILVAGGRVFSALFGTRSGDVDLFFHGVDHQPALQLVTDIFNELGHANVTRTANALTFEQNRKEIQVILRLYQTPSEVLHGFDVDCCSLGFDGKKIWATQRALYALTRGYNTINFGRLSPSYEYRLVKYGTRGMSIRVPNLDRDKIKVAELEARWQQWKEDLKDLTTGEPRYRRIKGKNFKGEERYPKLQGLDILLYLETHCRNYKWNKRTTDAVERLAAESSDYSPLPYTKCQYGVQGSSIHDLIEWVVGTADQYPEKAAVYLPLLERISTYCDEGDSLTQEEEFLMEARTSSLGGHGFAFIHISYLSSEEELQALLTLPDSIYLGLGAVFPWSIPQNITFKTIQPGEQMTGSFHQLVLKDVSIWYQGRYYQQ